MNIETERVNFRNLIAQNPNYFGNLTDTKFKFVKKIVNNTNYEELTCVGFNQNATVLEATIAIKLPGGYGGQLCYDGSFEYVRFFINYGAGWEDVGVAAVNVHDIPNFIDCAKQKDKPLMYVISLKIDPKTSICDNPMVPLVRAILSWDMMPPAGGANVSWSPIWGNSLDCHIQIKPRKKNISDLIDAISVQLPSNIQLKIPPEYESVIVHPLPIPDPPPLALPDLVSLYKGKLSKETEVSSAAGAVKAHRFGLQDIHPILTPNPLDQKNLFEKIEEWKSLGLDLQQAITALSNTKANVSYEEIECIGLDYGLESLVATFRVKLPIGYSGDLCKSGSSEYIAFWADWENECKWTYLGTASVNVHDLGKSLPKNGLCYSAILPVDFTHIRRGCENPKIGRIRAVLSWDLPPSTVDPDELKYWGNQLDAHIQIRPGPEIPVGGTPQPHIIVLGGIPVNMIDSISGMTTADAVFSAGGGYDPADPHHRPCPFGRKVDVKGFTLYPGYWYRVQVRNITLSSGWSDVKKTFTAWGWNGTDVIPTSQVAVNGFFQYLPLLLNIENILAVWDTLGDDLWEIRLQIATAPNEASLLPGFDLHRIQLDNTGPEVDIQITTPATSGGCKYTVGTELAGWFVARDANIGSFSLYVTPSGNTVVPSSVTPPYPSSGTPLYPPGQGWTLPTSGMDPCGYNIWVSAIDRSILNSRPDRHRSYKPVGFCLDAAVK